MSIVVVEVAVGYFTVFTVTPFTIPVDGPTRGGYVVGEAAVGYTTRLTSPVDGTTILGSVVVGEAAVD